MKVILNRDIRKLGKVGDVVTVKDGYGRNFLLPKKYVSVATKANIAKLQEKIEELKVKNDSLLKQAEKVADILSANIYNVARQASDDDIIYGSVRTKDIYNFICSLLQQNGVDFQLDIGGIIVSTPIKTLGQYIVPVEIFSDIVSNIRVNVCRTSAGFEQNIEAFDKKREKALMSEKDAKTKEKNAEKILSEQMNNVGKNEKSAEKTDGEVKAEKASDTNDTVDDKKNDDENNAPASSNKDKKTKAKNSKTDTEEEKNSSTVKKASKQKTGTKTKKDEN